MVKEEEEEHEDPVRAAGRVKRYTRRGGWDFCFLEPLKSTSGHRFPTLAEAAVLEIVFLAHSTWRYRSRTWI